MNNEHFSNSTEHLFAELKRINLLIESKGWKFRSEKSNNENTAYSSFEQLLDQVDNAATLIKQDDLDIDLDIKEEIDETSNDIAVMIRSSLDNGVMLRLQDLCTYYNLNDFEKDCLLICLSPEIDSSYQAIYSYLQNNPFMRRPGIELIINLLANNHYDYIKGLNYFQTESTLLQEEFVQPDEPRVSSKSALLSKVLKVDVRLAAYLLGSDDLDIELNNIANILTPDRTVDDLIYKQTAIKQLLQSCKDEPDNQKIVCLQGKQGTGKQAVAEAICHELDKKLLVIDGQRLVKMDLDKFIKLVKRIKREAWYQNAAILWQGFHIYFDEKKVDLYNYLLKELEGHQGLVFLATNERWVPQDELHKTGVLYINLPKLDVSTRLECWKKAENKQLPWADDIDLLDVATRYNLTASQVFNAAECARNIVKLSDGVNNKVPAAVLYQACKLHSTPKLPDLARKVNVHYKWDDIILADNVKRQLFEMRNYIKHSNQVYKNWGFDKKIAYGKGVSALFSGIPGTGKTMGADVIANELGLELFKVDLSSVVSKYIGETEKNLSKIFDEAESSNAILFFDEADAIFGKRSEVKDSHDRNANMEVSYLLQKMEEFHGVIVLSTNFKRNIDDAFVRRLTFMITFPMPTVEERLAIWTKIWPAEVTLASDVDLSLIAKEIELTGGYLRNIALGSAFLAAEENENSGSAIITMRHILHSAKREFQKVGKIIDKNNIIFRYKG